MEIVMQKIQNVNQMCSFVNSKRKIYIYGAKSNAQKMYQWFLNNRCRVDGFLVSKRYDNPEILGGMPVYRIENIKEIDANDAVVIAVGSKTTSFSGIVDSLNIYGFKEIAVPMKSFFNNAGNSFLSNTCTIKESALIDNSAVLWADETSEIFIDDYVTINGNVKITAYNNSKIYIGKNSYIDENSEIESTNGGNIRVGENVFFDQNARILAQIKAEITIGKDLKCGKYAYFTIANGGKLIIKKDCLMSSFVKIATGNHKLLDVRNNENISNISSIEIGEHVWIGMGVNLLAGTIIGDHTVVGAATVLTKEVGDHVTCAGNPARILRENIDWER